VRIRGATATFGLNESVRGSEIDDHRQRHLGSPSQTPSSASTAENDAIREIALINCSLAV
jgi:hypothetical protein